MSGRRALIVEHERPTPAGLSQEWLESRGLEVETFEIDERGGSPVAVTDYELIVSLGSEHAAYDDDELPWIATEMRLLREAVEADVAVLGICFGGQLLARSLGGSVFQARAEEIGWLGLDSERPELVDEGPWFQWHFDTFTVPEGASTVATTRIGPQAFTYGRSLGVQFHPEVTPRIMDRWVAVYRHELDRHGVDPDGLLATTRELAEPARERSYRLFDAFLERAAPAPTGGS